MRQQRAFGGLRFIDGELRMERAAEIVKFRTI
jgi:hypothetical protein